MAVGDGLPLMAEVPELAEDVPKHRCPFELPPRETVYPDHFLCLFRMYSRQPNGNHTLRFEPYRSENIGTWLGGRRKNDQTGVCQIN